MQKRINKRWLAENIVGFTLQLPWHTGSGAALRFKNRAGVTRSARQLCARPGIWWNNPTPEVINLAEIGLIRSQIKHSSASPSASDGMEICGQTCNIICGMHYTCYVSEKSRHRGALCTVTHTSGKYKTTDHPGSRSLSNSKEVNHLPNIALERV